MNLIGETDDWRINGQEEYLTNVQISKKAYQGDSHEHCIFCWHKFMPTKDGSNEGYCTVDNKYWICKTCYNDFKDIFHWKLTQ